jgi:hypothetical protein
MALSSVSVVGSSLALRFYRPPILVDESERPRRSSTWRRVSVDSAELTQPLLQLDGTEGDPTERAADLSQMEEGQES